jgi:hypothetical protein
MTIEGMGPCVAVVGSTTACGVRGLRRAGAFSGASRGASDLLDNLGAHKGDTVHRLIEGSGCEVLYLPPYSPNLKWDEKAQIMLRQGPLRCPI